MSYGIIYKATNKVNGKVYIGQTIRTLNIRWKGHISEAKSRENCPFHCAINKYGAENFFVEKLCDCYTQEELNKKEVYYTDFYQAWIEQNGYVCKAGKGRGTTSESTKEKISKAGKGRIFSDKHKLNLSLAQTGKKNHRYGKPISSILKEKLRATHIGQKLSKEHREKFITARIKEYDVVSPQGEVIHVINMNEFCRENKLSNGAMSNVISGKRKHHKGWKKHNATVL